MNKTSLTGKWMILLAMLILMSSIASAFGITPGRTTMDFQSEMEKEVQFSIINSQHQNMKVLLTIEGELADYIKLEEHLIEFKASDEQKDLSYKIKLPKKIATPGDHEAEIVATIVTAEQLNVGKTVSATTAVATQLKIHVPYPGKYVEARLEISEGNANEETAFIIPVHNFGEENIAKASAEITIQDKDKKTVMTLKTGEAEIEPKRTRELVASWVANVEPGEYHAIAKVTYDGTEQIVENDFNVGSMFMDLKAVTVKNFNLGGIAKFNVLVENKWGTDVKDLFAELVITNELGDVIASVKSATMEVSANNEAVLDVFWDTENIKSGSYTTRIVLHYSGRSTEKLMKTDVTLDSITNSFAGTATGQVISEGQNNGIISKGGSIFMLVAVGVITLLVAVKLIKGMRKKRK